MVRGTISLPNGTGKTARVIVFAVGDKAAEAEAAGADAVGSEDLIEKIQGGWLNFDAAIATPTRWPGRPDRARPGSAWPDAEPQSRPRLAGCDQGCQRHQGRQDQLPCRQGSEPALRDRQGLVHTGAAGTELRRRLAADHAGRQLLGRQGALPGGGGGLHDDGSGYRCRDPSVSRNFTDAAQGLIRPIARLQQAQPAITWHRREGRSATAGCPW